MKQRTGFTLVELLIVIVVIAILAAISIVAYNGIQTRAHATSVNTDLSNVKKKLEMNKIISGTYPHSPTTSTPDLRTALEEIDLKLATDAYSTESNGNLVFISENDGSKYSLIAKPKNSPSLYVASDSSVVDYQDEYSSCPAFPGGSSTTIASCLGFSASNTVYYIYVKSGGGFRIWSD